VRKEQKGASKRMNGKLTEGPEENRCSPGGLMHAAAKATWPGDAHDQDASTGSSQVPSRNHSKNLTKNHSKEPHGTTVKNEQERRHQEIQPNPTQTSMIHPQNLHRRNSTCYKSIPKKSSPGINPNSGKNSDCRQERVFLLKSENRIDLRARAKLI